jgi:hypothetical protein
VADALQKLFSDEVYCRQEIVRIREAWGDRRTFTVPMVDAARKTLGFMQLYGSESLQTIVDATLIELSRREVLGLFAGLLAAPRPSSQAQKRKEKYDLREMESLL